MKYFLTLFSITTLLFTSCSGESKNTETPSENKDSTATAVTEFESNQAKISYAFGIFKSDDINKMYGNEQLADKIDRTEILAGIDDILNDNEISYEQDSATAIAKAYLATPAPSENQKREASYCIGLVEGWYIKDFFGEENLEYTVDFPILFQGIKDALVSKENQKLDRNQAIKAITPIMQAYTEKSNSRFLVENAKLDSVTVTASGLQYKVIRKGKGKKPKATDRVTVHYAGRLVNGKLFDTSMKEFGGEGNPITFGLNEVIAGWTEGLQLMREGAKYIFYIPSEIGYGSTGSGPIPPNSTLIFEVELISVN